MAVYGVDRVLQEALYLDGGGQLRQTFLVKWSGYDESDATWELLGDLNQRVRDVDVEPLLARSCWRLSTPAVPLLIGTPLTLYVRSIGRRERRLDHERQRERSRSPAPGLRRLEGVAWRCTALIAPQRAS